jgi:hypothetical protein
MTVRDGFGQSIVVVAQLSDLKIAAVQCPHGDEVKAGTGGCTPNGTYCGGNEVSGVRDVLYRCVAGKTATEIAFCPSGCEIRPGQNDACKK